MLPLLLVILDGWGYNPDHEGNACFASEPKHLNELAIRYPFTLLETSGATVGVSSSVMLSVPLKRKDLR